MRDRTYTFFIATLLILSPTSERHAFAQSDSDFMEKAAYAKTFKAHTLSITPDHLNFIIDNLTSSLDIILQSEPDFLRHRLNGKFHSYSVEGTPERFNVTSHNNSAVVIRERNSANEITYRARVETQKFAVPLSGELLIKLRIHSSQDNEPSQCIVDIDFAFKPVSDIASAALRPIIKSAIATELDKFSIKTLAASSEFIKILNQQIPTYLTNKNLLTQISKLYQENKRLKAGSTLPATVSTASQQASDSDLSWIITFIAFCLGVSIGLAVGRRKNNQSAAAHGDE